MLKLIEGFEGLGTSTGVAPVGLERKYNIVSSSNLIDIEAGRTGGFAAEFQSTSAWFQTFPLTTDDTLIVGMAFKWTAANDDRLIALYDGVTEGVNLRMKTDGEYEVRLANSLLGTTSAASVGMGNWCHLELKVVTHASAGSVELRINGVTKLNLTGIDTQPDANAYHNMVRFLGPTFLGYWFDDVYVLDGAGTVNNDFLGNMKVIGILPSAEGDNIDFTPSTGSNNADMVDENPADDDTSYVEASGAGSKDLYEYGDVSGLGDLIAGVQINTDVKETDATTFDLITVVKSGSTESDDAAQPIGSTSYVTKSRIVELDPDTAALWTAAGINAAQFGIKIG